MTSRLAMTSHLARSAGIIRGKTISMPRRILHGSHLLRATIRGCLRALRCRATIRARRTLQRPWDLLEGGVRTPRQSRAIGYRKIGMQRMIRISDRITGRRSRVTSGSTMVVPAILTAHRVIRYTAPLAPGATHQRQDTTTSQSLLVISPLNHLSDKVIAIAAPRFVSAPRPQRHRGRSYRNIDRAKSRRWPTGCENSRKNSSTVRMRLKG